MTLPSRGSYRVVIVEDHVLFAESLELALSMDGYDVRRIPLPEHASSPGSLLSAVLRNRPRIVLLDLDLGRFGDGAKLISPIVRSGAQVVVVTSSADRGRWGECLRAGARKVVTKARPLNEIRSIVRRLHQGLPVMDREEREELLRVYHKQRLELTELRDRVGRLTAREREVLGDLMQGHTVRDIAATSVVSEATVRTQVKSILAKLEVSSQLAAVGLAHHVGWRPPER
jgi:DNA-binding NarL/FixJ family response regulator